MKHPTKSQVVRTTLRTQIRQGTMFQVTVVQVVTSSKRYEEANDLASSFFLVCKIHDTELIGPFRLGPPVIHSTILKNKLIEKVFHFLYSHQCHTKYLM